MIVTELVERHRWAESGRRRSMVGEEPRRSRSVDQFDRDESSAGAEPRLSSTCATQHAVAMHHSRRTDLDGGRDQQRAHRVDDLENRLGSVRTLTQR